ncbi:arylsulfatase [Novosphingobium malaysiense]|nr:arylsulfatase [Novosphingobium malaysiense]
MVCATAFVAIGAILSGAAPAQTDVGLTFKDSGPSHPPVAPHPSSDAPNIVLIMLDDVGYGQFGTFGGAVPSPAMDALAKEGLRFTRFHTTGICSPTRAALLTGRNHHNAGFGINGEMATGYDGYTGVIPSSTATFAKVLQESGYATAWFGKNHNTPVSEAGPAGPFNHWPTGMGFDHFYGFNGWGADQWSPVLYNDTTPVPPSTDPDYILNTDLADKAIAWMHKVQSTAPGKPYLLYLATGATHAPHHAPPEWIAKFKGKFDDGWDAYREKAFARQKQLGVIPQTAKLTPRPDAIPAWDTLSAEKKRIYAREMEVFAGFSAHTDYEVGRVIKAAQEQSGSRDTLVIYILGDNGASAEGGLDGTINELAPGNFLAAEAAVTTENLPKLGGPDYDNHMSYGWAWAVDAPFRYYKQVVSHLGAIRNPMIVSWPSHIKDPGAVRSQFLHVIDIAPTILDAAGMKMPESVDGVPQKPLDGVDALPVVLDGKTPEVRKIQYFEMMANRGIFANGWFASAKISDPWIPYRANLDPFAVKWELYNLDKDFTQADDLADVMPGKLQQMKDLWWAQAGRNNVLPIDWRVGTRMNPKPKDRNHYVLYPGTINYPELIGPDVRNRTWTATAKGTFNASDKGMIVTQGGVSGGWAFYLRDGVPVFDYNLMGIHRYRVTGSHAIPDNAKSLEMRFAYSGKASEQGAGGVVSFYADGKPVGKGTIERTLPNFISLTEGLDVGADYGSPVADYPFPAPFSGDLQSVTLDMR